MNKEEKTALINKICDKDAPYEQKISAYEYLSEEGGDVVEEMLAALYKTEGDDAQMLMEILANYKGRKDIYLWLVTFFYKGDDYALFAKLLGSYGDPSAIEVLNSFAEENELDYNEYMEFRNAVEELGGNFTSKQDFSDDPFFKFIKGLNDGEADGAEEAPQEHCGCGHEKGCDCDDEDCDCDDEECSCEQDEDCDCEDEDCGCEDDCGCGEHCACEEDDSDCEEDDSDCDEDGCDCGDSDCGCGGRHHCDEE